MQPTLKLCLHKIVDSFSYIQRNRLKKELFIFVLIFSVLALGMHMSQWLTHPLEHIAHLSTHKMPYHPLLYTTIVYSILALIRVVINAIIKLFRKR